MALLSFESAYMFVQLAVLYIHFPSFVQIIENAKAITNYYRVDLG